MNTPNIIKKYLWFLETIYWSNGISLEELKERWVKTEFSNGEPLIRQTFNRYRREIEDLLGIYIECRLQDGYRYYIEDMISLKENSFKGWMLDTLSISNILIDSGSLQDRLLMEHIPSGTGYFKTIARAMKINHKLRISYRKFGQESPYTIEVEPYAIKVFKQRWYLLAKNYKRNTPTIYALDRMESVEELQTTFHYPSDFSAKSFFQNYFGVLCPPDSHPRRIVVRAYYPYANYLRTLPLHRTQTELTDTPEYADFEFYLCPTFDFKQELLAQGKDVEVLKPASLRLEMKEMILEAMGRYKE